MKPGSVWVDRRRGGGKLAECEKYEFIPTGTGTGTYLN